MILRLLETHIYIKGCGKSLYQCKLLLGDEPNEASTRMDWFLCVDYSFGVSKVVQSSAQVTETFEYTTWDSVGSLALRNLRLMMFAFAEENDHDRFRLVSPETLSNEEVFRPV